MMRILHAETPPVTQAPQQPFANCAPLRSGHSDERTLGERLVGGQPTAASGGGADLPSWHLWPNATHTTS